MELMNHSDVADKELVNTFGGVAYDHDSMPRLVGVHSWTAKQQNLSNEQGETPSFPSFEHLPSKMCYSMNIGIRNTPQNADVGSQRMDTVSKENLGVRSTKFENKFSHLSSFGVEKLNQTEARQINAVTTCTGTTEIRRTLLQEHRRDASEELCPSHDKTFFGKELRNMSKICNLLTEHTNGKNGFVNRSEAVTEVLPLDENLTSPSSLKSPDNHLFTWSRIGVLADTSPKSEQLQSSHQHVQPLTTNNNLRFYSENRSKTAAAGNNNCSQEQISDSSVLHKELNSNSRLSNSFDGSQISQTPHLSSRKRPRKSIPRKIDVEWQKSFSGSNSTDSEGTFSADEKTSESPSQSESTSVRSSPKRCSPRSDEESSSIGTKVLFKKTAGVWSVSQLNSDVDENKELEGSWNSSKETARSEATTDNLRSLYGSMLYGCNKPARNICLFTDRAIASLMPYDPLDPHSAKPLYSPALDREVRIKELLSKQEKLLAEMRQKKGNV